ncbi:MAG: hypothetical protein AB1540_05665 [Bdellovibrionota bacterium]
MRRPGKTLRQQWPVWWIALSVVLPVLLLVAWPWIQTTQPWGIRLFFDDYDLKVYFHSSRWVVDGGTLYRDVFSEYPCVANLLFAGVRLLSEWVVPLSHPFDRFSWMWMSLAWVLYIQLLRIVRGEKQSLWIWIAPAPIYFALLRYDFYPTLTCFLALLEWKKGRWHAGTLWFSLCIALKGYGLFLMPSLFVYFFVNLGLRQAIKLSTLCLGAFLLSHLAVIAWAGWEGLMMPYQFHMTRSNNGESTYDVLEFALLGLGVSSETRTEFLQVIAQGIVPKIGLIATSLVAAALVPRTFQELVRSMLIGVVGFISTSIFYSPQFVLWIAGVATFSESNLVRVGSAALNWLSFAHFPVTYDLRPHYQKPYKNMVAVVASVRLLLLAVAFRRPRHSKASRGKAN